jgi:hypothetical protein
VGVSWVDPPRVPLEQRADGDVYDDEVEVGWWVPGIGTVTAISPEGLGIYRRDDGRDGIVHDRNPVRYWGGVCLSREGNNVPPSMIRRRGRASLRRAPVWA